MSLKRVYDFREGSRGMRDLLGGKGANVAEMTRLGLPVPEGFTVTTEACMAYLAEDGMPGGLEQEIRTHLAALEEQAGRGLGDAADPLLVSVRSGARDSMPGMMDTVLNLGLNESSVEGLAERTGNPRFAWDSYRRFVQMYGDVVAGVDRALFESALAALKQERGVADDVDLTADDLQGLTRHFHEIYADATGTAFPSDPWSQLEGAVCAVFSSWDNKRARDYRAVHRIAHDLGTAVNVQRMVFGNTGEGSATGVAFTRSNVTGEKGEPFGDFLINAQGEDVVAGIRTPHPLTELADQLPDAYAQLLVTMERLETTYKNMQDVEFTIEDGRLYMLQTRDGKRSAAAMAQIAVDLADEGIVTEDEALTRLVDADQVRQLLLPQLDLARAESPVASGVDASPGAATGAAVFTADEAERRGQAGEAVILVRDETTPDDFHGMIAARGILTARGGKTSHAAIVAVGMGVPAVCGVAGLTIDERAGAMTIGSAELSEGDVITIDGTRGTVYAGAAPLSEPDPDSPALARILGWADGHRRLSVRANADTPDDARRAREFGAEGIGLCRTEHMFQGDERLPIVQEMILAADEDRIGFLDQLRPIQEGDFEGIFRAMEGLPVTIRLLDPPLHEFLPDRVELALRVERARLSGSPDADCERQLARVEELHEVNPMLGLRGCRLGIEWPNIYRMQVAAIMSAACTVKQESGTEPQVEIMIPLVGFREELSRVRAEVVDVANAVLVERDEKIDYLVGTMIELPRAALTAGSIATAADFFSFGTNDLTQTTLGFSRDDAEARFLATYLEAGVVAANPFETVDIEGVGELVRGACEAAREARPGIKLGVCGEHGGDPASVTFFHGVGLDYVSCSPFRVQTARIAAAQAALADRAPSDEQA